MGAKASKPAQTAARRFPTRAAGSPPNPTTTTTRSQPKARPPPTQTPSPEESPDTIPQPFSDRLRAMGIATPQPTYSPSSTATTSPLPSFEAAQAPLPPQYPPSSSNRTLSALEARRRLQARADAEFDDPSGGREFLDAPTLRRALLLRETGMREAEIERTLRLKAGVVGRLGPRGVTVPVDTAGMNRQTWGGLHE